MPGSLPFFGHLFAVPPNLAFSAVEEAMRASGARMMVIETMLRPDVLILRHPDDCAAVSRDQEAFGKQATGWDAVRDWLGWGLVSQEDAARHAAVRDVLAPAFRAASVRGFEPLFTEAGDAMAEVLLAQAAAAGRGAAVDVRDACRRATLDVIGRAAFGYDFGTLRWAAAAATGGADAGAAAAAEGQPPPDEDVVALFDAVLYPGGLLLFQTPIPRPLVPGIKGYDRGVAKLREVARRVMQAKRAAGPEAIAQCGDILSFMLAAQAAGNDVITDAQISDELNTFMLAGSDTTATTLAFALYELSRHPGIAAACAAEADAVLAPADGRPLQARMPLITAVVNETLRLYPAATEIARTALRDAPLGGYLVKAGTIVLPSQYSTHRNPEFWPRADEWLPERWLPDRAAELAPHADKAFFPFSVGPRACIGRYFAVLEMQLLLAAVLRRVQFDAVEGFTAKLFQTFTLTTDGGTLVVPRLRQAQQGKAGMSGEQAAAGPATPAATATGA